MAQKFITLVAGVQTEVEATVVSAGAGDAGKVVALDASGRVDNSVMPVGIGADTKSLVAFENLAAGDLVNVFDDGGTEKVRKADASNGRRAHGFVLSAVTATNPATVYFEGTITGLTGLTRGAQYYVSGGTAGLATSTAPSTTGHIVQDIGVAVSATEISFEPQRPTTLA